MSLVRTVEGCGRQVPVGTRVAHCLSCTCVANPVWPVGPEWSADFLCLLSPPYEIYAKKTRRKNKGQISDLWGVWGVGGERAQVFRRQKASRGHQGWSSLGEELRKSTGPEGGNSVMVVAFWLSASPDWDMPSWPCCWTCCRTQSMDIVWESVGNAEPQAPRRCPEAESAFHRGALGRGTQSWFVLGCRVADCRSLGGWAHRYPGPCPPLFPARQAKSHLPCKCPREQLGSVLFYCLEFTYLFLNI